ncbi:MAG: NADH-quinone oxidoreductase subunit L [Chloroflexi bacterium]|nr:NADH-quinone oxidoreductase subunit L [Chloroflexota bacterium]MCI0579180.1 NADH-quinone oxidoreductase subunit L [Chloroflexota bacterium]MCI0645259.1 NADH-quinone oxidoreductase subunit L [Chloroflexota bacterium]MCI0726763.1 NADH-quinone oxidoreductase subunit L [Chloroflexota bacterium]
MEAFGLAPLILVFPVVGLLFNALAGRRFVEADREVGEKWSGWVASLMALAAFVIAVLLGLSLAANNFHTEVVHLFDWVNIPSADFRVPWAIRVDTLSVAMMLVVTGVGSLIHIYAIGYMHGDPDFSRFFTYMNLFLFFMLILVTGNNYLMLFVGWEGVGLCSFLLIGFWFDRVDEARRPMNANAARKAFVANRVGDFAMVLAMILAFWSFGSLDFDRVFSSAEELAGEAIHFGSVELSLGVVLTAITTLFLIGATGKSAQIPLYVWLPDAMAGPTPVSALIHAATMVTSGIYLIVRSNVLFEMARARGVPLLGVISSPDLVATTGAATALLAGLIAFTQFDIKKVLAYSTISQLGFMIAAAGMGAYVAAMFHLITHAFFKALLFLGSGSVIHGMEHGHHHLGHDSQSDDDHHAERFDAQDMRTMGGLKDKMPWTYRVYLVGALALAGIFPLSGFWSKDEILVHANSPENNYQVIYWILTAAAVCTAFYMGRQLKMVFFGAPRHEAAKHASESPPIITVPLVILAILAFFGGVLNLPYFGQAPEHPEGSFLMLEQWLEHSITAIELSVGEEGEALLDLPETPKAFNLVVAGISTGLAVLSLGLAMGVVYRNRPQTAAERDPLQSTPIWWFSILPLNTLYMRGVVPLFNRLAHWLAETIDDRLWHDFFHDRLVRNSFVYGARFVNDVFDTRGIDGLLVNGSGRLARWLGDQFRTTQTGYARNYALGIFLGVIALLAYFLFF